MRKLTIGLTLAAALVLAIGSAGMAAPVTAGEAGSFFVFGEYSPFIFYAPFNVMGAGAGYTIADGVALGVEAQFYAGNTLVGGFANLSLHPIALNGEALVTPGGTIGKVSALYRLDLEPIQLGLGGGAIVAAGMPGPIGFVECAANVALSDNISLYGAVDYLVQPGIAEFKGGVSFGF